MSEKWVNNKNAAGNSVLNLVIQVLSSPPSSPVPGLWYYDSTLLTARFWNGSVWVNEDATLRTGIPFANLSSPTAPFSFGSQVLNNLATPVAATDAANKGYIDNKTLDTFSSPVNPLSLNNQRITNLSTPINPSDAANMSYVIAQVQSSAAGLAGKASVVAVSTTNVATMSGLTTVVDGVTLGTAGERVLLTAQTTASQNGPWVVQSGSWTRPTTDANNELETGALWFVEQGTTYTASQWWLSSPSAGNAITPGTTSITIVQYGAAPAYTASNGVQKTGNNFSAAVVPSGGILTGPSGLQLDTTVAVRKFSATIGDGSTTAIVVTHNLGTLDVHMQVRDSPTAPSNVIECDMQATTINTATFTFSVAPAANAYRATIFA